jgi:phenylacetate-CoA ligase
MLNKIYGYFPTFIQNILISIYGYYWKRRRYGGVFEKHILIFKAHERFSEKQWEDYQTKELRKLLIHAFTTVPFYKKLYEENGFSLSSFQQFEISDLKKLPFLEKEDLRKFGDSELLSSKRVRGKFYASSGSTGTPVKIYFSKKSHQIWSALYETRVRNWAGVNFKDSRIMIGGRRVLPNNQQKPPFYRYNHAEKQYYFSAYHISLKNTKFYVEAINESRAAYIVGYAMSIFLLAKNIQSQQLKVNPLKAILTSSEKLTLVMRNTIEEVFKCKVFDAYSGVEACGLISENQVGELIFSNDSGIMEILNANGEDVKSGETGEVIATGFINYDQPLIRYRIGDCVNLSKKQQSKSGCHMLMIEEIEGRAEDVVIGVNGQQMVRFHGIFINIPLLILAQVIQISLKEMIIKLVVEEQFDKNYEQVMISRLTSQLGAVSISFEYVSEIEKTKSGKYKAVISMLKYE